MTELRAHVPVLSADLLGKLYPSVVLHRLAAAMLAGELNFIVPVGGLDRSYSHGHETFGADEMPHASMWQSISSPTRTGTRIDFESCAIGA
jgi:hypothetical protein